MITTTTLASGALIAQALVLGILGIAVLILRERSYFTYRDPNAHFPVVALVIVFLTLGPLLLSEGLTALWRPLLGTFRPVTVAHHTATLIIFVVDILCIAYLVAHTGGSQNSPFQAMFFLMPTLAIFLREPVASLLTYVALVATSFSFLLVWLPALDYTPYSGAKHRLAYWFVSLASCFVAVFIGYYTSPR